MKFIFSCDFSTQRFHSKYDSIQLWRKYYYKSINIVIDLFFYLLNFLDKCRCSELLYQRFYPRESGDHSAIFNNSSRAYRKCTFLLFPGYLKLSTNVPSKASCYIYNIVSSSPDFDVTRTCQ